MHVDYFADKSQIDPGGFSLGLRRKFLADQDMLSKQPDGLPAEIVQRLDNSRVDFVVEHLFDNPDRLLVSHAQPIHELRF